MTRSSQPGWEPIATQGRRGLWMRRTAEGVELCAGREGDDDHVSVRVGDVVSPGTLRDLLGVLTTAAYGLGPENAGTPRGT